MKINSVKKILKNNNQFSFYKKSFLVRKNFFIITKFAQLFNSNISLDDLVTLEIDLAKNITKEEQWVNSFLSFSKYLIKPWNNCDWKSLASFLFYSWNINLFHKKKHQHLSIYNLENFNILNSKKMQCYQHWINSCIENKINDFNFYIKNILRLI